VRASTAQRGRPANRPADQTRTRLLDAATIVFALRGYTGASVTELVQHAGVTPPVLYHHFGNKAGLYVATLTRAYDLVIGAFAAATATAADYREALGILFRSAGQLHEAHPELAAFVAAAPVEAPLDPELDEARAQLARTRIFLRGLVARCGPLPGASAEVSVNVGAVIIGGLNRLAATRMDPLEYARTAQALTVLMDSRTTNDAGGSYAQLP
jgi:AcrR family transcriptional regulator